MVWFQCEDCGENLKKPKLQNHFRCCSANKLSCIDCGVIFTQQSVQGHTQCVSEAEKYGPKGASYKKENVQAPVKEYKSDGVDLNLGLSIRPPWNCSICNVKATSQETLVLHSQGKKHRSKARSLSLKATNSGDLSTTVALTPVPVQSSLSINGNAATVCSGDELVQGKQDNGKPEDGSLRKEGTMVDGNNNETKAGGESNLPASEKKKRSKSENRSMEENNSKRVKGSKNMKNANNDLTKTGHMNEKAELFDEHVNGNHVLCDVNKTPSHQPKIIKWKKLIKRTLQAAPDCSMKLKKFRKTVISLAVQKIGEPADEASLLKELDNQIQLVSKLVMEGKRVWLQG